MYYKRKSVVLKYYMIVRHFYKKLHKASYVKLKSKLLKCMYILQRFVALKIMLMNNKM